MFRYREMKMFAVGLKLQEEIEKDVTVEYLQIPAKL